ncbi:putative quinol monooxygenase [Companilactobacillus mishanensis]|uniref:putative quinol monooxygenase n=1 Tax=Companilactobacillus mishanensis TaxID=2486008 RepID=UPI001294CCCF|nr:putative quinol monooxygenase [Companilactobacillus mishanensis]MQS90300.1 antibiotic biosynthesis monooxygenase [Companilactobacillus mishanensis]
MKIINVSLKVKPGKEAAYEEFVSKLVEGSSNEAGNISYGHYKKLGTKDEYEIIEHWKDAAAVESHNATPHFQNFAKNIGEYVTEDPDIIRMDH